MKYKKAWALAFLCVVIDGGLTYAALETGVAREANPVMLDAMEEWGVECAIFGSIFTRFAVFALCIEMQEHALKWDWVVPLIIVPVAVLPVPWNLYVLGGILLV